MQCRGTQACLMIGCEGRGAGAVLLGAEARRRRARVLSGLERMKGERPAERQRDRERERDRLVYREQSAPPPGDSADTRETWTGERGSRFTPVAARRLPSTARTSVEGVSDRGDDGASRQSTASVHLHVLGEIARLREGLAAFEASKSSFFCMHRNVA